MRPPLPCLLFFLAATVCAPISSSAALDSSTPPSLRLERLNLNDGRRLGDVLIQSYDATTNRFFIVVDNTATVISADLVPDGPREEIKSAVKRTDSTPPREAVAQPSTPAPDLDSVAIPSRLPGGSLSGRDEHNESAALIAAHRGAALAHAERHYRFEFRAGSDQVSVTALDFDISEPEPIPGWPGQFRTAGRAFLEFYDSRGNSFQRATSTFEVITEQKPGEPLRVERFERRS